MYFQKWLLLIYSPGWSGSKGAWGFWIFHGIRVRRGVSFQGRWWRRREGGRGGVVLGNQGRTDDLGWWTGKKG
jgi:hypothetical protein